MINGFPTHIYQTFVGSLRATGYSGNIILGIASDAPTSTVDYLASQNVTIKYIENAEKCTYNGTKLNTGKVIDMQTTKGWKCTKEHPDYKLTWARFVHYADWLIECTQCTDGVILTDVRDAYFQRDPFVTAVERNQQYPLMVFEEDPETDNRHWLSQIPIKSCHGAQVANDISKKRMLCSGSTMGSRGGILEYLSVMKDEFDYWKTREECRVDLKGDDQSIHNYLYYTGRFKNAVSVPYRRGPINVVGYRAAKISEEAKKFAKEVKGLDKVTGDLYVQNGKWQEWIPKEYGMIDPDTGLILNIDGTISAQIHQFDRFGELQSPWISKMKELGWPYNKASEKATSSEKQLLTGPSCNHHSSYHLRDLPTVAVPHGTFHFAPHSHELCVPGNEKIVNSWTTEQATLLDDDVIDIEKEKQRCASYNLGLRKYDNGTALQRRRLFMGALIATDSLEVLKAVGTEAHNIYHTVSYIESHVAPSWLVPRKWRYLDNGNKSASSVHQLYQFFGDQTRVSVDFYVTNRTDKPSDTVLHEYLQKEGIIDRWMMNGMTSSDIAIIQDADETFTRDFLRAMQICDIPAFRLGEQDCRASKVIASATVFESSSECRTKGRRWHHPDAILGECVKGFGNSTLHPLTQRNWQPKGFNVTHGKRDRGYGADSYAKYREMYPGNNVFPLWTAEDIRTHSPGSYISHINGIPTGYHFHNFFETAAEIRTKYATYTHGEKRVMQGNGEPVWNFHEDVDLAVRCAKKMNRPDVDSFMSIKKEERPIYYLNEASRNRRHEVWQSIISEEEDKYGRYVYGCNVTRCRS